MRGQQILVRSILAQSIGDKFGNSWQYHSRSDRHSKLACWTVLFDVLLECPMLQRHVEAGKVAFGINHRMTQFTTGRTKDLDLVICVPLEDDRRAPPATTFAELATMYRVVLTAEDEGKLTSLPRLVRRPVARVLMALEAKACMTEHVKAGPRLYDELTASSECIHGTAQEAIAVGYAMVNSASEFLSPLRNKFHLVGATPVVNHHSQPADTFLIYDRLSRLPVRSNPHGHGFDAIGITTIDMRNDGGPVRLASVPPGLSPDHQFNYQTMIRRITGIYASRFAEL